MKKILKTIFYATVLLVTVCAYCLAGIYVLGNLFMSESSPAWVAFPVLFFGILFGGMPSMIMLDHFGIFKTLDNAEG